jgi:hypothetical protein
MRRAGEWLCPSTKGKAMRKTVLLLASTALVVLLVSGVALAVTKVGGPGGDTLMGTRGSDELSGRGAATGSTAEAVGT